MGWQSDMTQQVEALSARERIAWQRCVDGLRILAGGNESDTDDGLTYLGHLKNVHNRHLETLRQTAAAIKAGNYYQAQPLVVSLGQLVAQVEGLAGSIENRVAAMQSLPGAPAADVEGVGQVVDDARAIAPVSTLLVVLLGAALVWSLL